MSVSVSKESIKSLVDGHHGSPRDILGPHMSTEGETATFVVRTFQPHAMSAELIQTATNEARPMNRIHKAGLFELAQPEQPAFAYRLRMTDATGHTWEIEDPYRFAPRLTDFDLHLFNEGTNYRAYEKFGAHPVTLDDVTGVHFAVWAPNARRVSVVGAFNRWDGRCHPMQRRGASGVWELFIPGLQATDLYKYEIRGQRDFLAVKSDPYAFASQKRPDTASVVWPLRGYAWQDSGWMSHRAGRDWMREPVSVYEVHLGSWKRHAGADGADQFLSYRELADDLIPYVKQCGFTHIELLPISEHPFDGSWGYQTTGYFAPTSRFGTPDDFKFFVDRCHQEGIGVILDWVPAHFPRDAHGLARFDGTHLYEHADPRQGEHRDWGTLIFNFGRCEIRTFLLSSAVFWAEEYHLDGLRVDAVASMLYLDYSRSEGEWIPNKHGGRENLDAVEFIKKFSEVMHHEFPGILTFAEESTAWPMVSRPTYLGGLGFGLKWNMGWMHDILEYMSKDPVHRKYHHNNLTFSMIYAFTENFILPFSHDEVVHGKRSMIDKMPGDLWQKFANLRLLYAFLFAHPGKKLLFMGAEFAQWNEWNSDVSLDWSLLEFESHRKLRDMVSALNRLLVSEPPLHEIDFSWDGFEWIDFHDSDQSTLSFLRKGRNAGDLVVCVFNFTPVPREDYRLGVPRPGLYQEIFNSDAVYFGGGNIGNAGCVATENKPWNARPCSLRITVPPLGAVFFKPAPNT